jgi:acyl carrier protein
MEAGALKERLRDFVLAEGDWYGTRGELTDDVSILGNVIDSVALVTLVAMLEDDFGIEIGEQDLTWENFGTIARIAGFVARASPVESAMIPQET